MAKKDKNVAANPGEIKNDTLHAVDKFKFSDFIMMFILVILCLTCILPFIHIAAKSLSENSYVIAKEVFLWPKGFTTSAYSSVFSDATMTYSMGYSAIVTIVFTILGMVACTCAAYPLSRKRLKGRKVFTFLLMVPMYFSAGIIPSYMLYKSLHMLDNVWVLILPLIYSSYNMLIMKNFFQANIPDELEEAPFLDGATNFQILCKIVLPLSKAIIATLSLFYAVGRWNAYSDNMYFITSQNLRMIQYKLYLLVAGASEAQTSSVNTGGDVVEATPEVLQSAAVMFVTVPIVCIYPFVQKYFVKGTMVGAVKG